MQMHQGKAAGNDTMTHQQAERLLTIPLQRPLAFFDLETTGLDIKQDRIVEIAIVRYSPIPEIASPYGGLLEDSQRFNPGIPIPKEVAEIHGITDEDVADEPAFSDYAPMLLDHFDGCDLAGFNLRKFDVPLLVEEFKRAGMPFDMAGRRVIDAQMIYHKEEPRNLAGALRFYTGDTLRNAHTALADTRATAAILFSQIERYKELPGDIAGLHGYCDEIEAEGGFFKKHESAGEGSGWVFQKGKFKGQILAKVAATSRGYGYLGWMLRLDDLSDPDRRVIKEALG